MHTTPRSILAGKCNGTAISKTVSNTRVIQANYSYIWLAELGSGLINLVFCTLFSRRIGPTLDLFHRYSSIDVANNQTRNRTYIPRIQRLNWIAFMLICYLIHPFEPPRFSLNCQTFVQASLHFQVLPNTPESRSMPSVSAPSCDMHSLPFWLFWWFHSLEVGEMRSGAVGTRGQSILAGFLRYIINNSKVSCLSALVAWAWLFVGVLCPSLMEKCPELGE